VSAEYLVEYIFRGRKTVYWARRVIKWCIVEVEDEIDEGEEFSGAEPLVKKADDGEIHLYVRWVNPSWKPGEVYELMFREKLRGEGCELELVTPNS